MTTTSNPRVRFAPSPTGYLHVGGARTALFNWLFARSTRGTLILRIEDTDRERSTEAHTQVILDGLAWLGIPVDEGPYFQGESTGRHREDALRLLQEGRAYRCFCTREELDAQRQAAGHAQAAFRYDRRCHRLDRAESERRAAAGELHVIRFLMPEGEIAWDDAVHGRISFQGSDLDDLVILRSDGTPIYNLAVVSDDIAMRITHVIRGDDHISNTPKQIALYRALDRTPPVFAHVPMILGADGKKLSKRHGATAVGDYRSRGILPLAMRNFLALLGWSPGEDREILPEEEMIALFSLNAIQKKPAVFDTAKLEWMNGQYLSRLPAVDLVAPVSDALAGLGITADGDLVPLIEAVKARSRTITQISDQVAVRLRASPEPLDDKALKFIRKQGESFPRDLRLVTDALSEVNPSEWNAESILTAIRNTAETHDRKLGDVMQPVRIALTGGTVSEPVNELLEVMGRKTSLAKLEASLAAGLTSA